MMANKNEIVMGADVRDLLRGTKDMTAALKRQFEGLREISEVTKRYAEETEAQAKANAKLGRTSEVIGLKFKAITQEGQKLQATLKKVGKEWSLVTNTIQEQKTEYDKILQRLKQFGRIARKEMADRTAAEKQAQKERTIQARLTLSKIRKAEKAAIKSRLQDEKDFEDALQKTQRLINEESRKTFNKIQAFERKKIAEKKKADAEFLAQVKKTEQLILDEGRKQFQKIRDFERRKLKERKENARKAAQAEKELQQSTKRVTKQLVLSWQSVFRIFQVQALHTIIGRSISAMSRAIDDASEFLIKVSEIQTISQQNQQSTEQWAGQLRSLSDAFGLNVLDVAEASYQTISNQIAKGAEATKFMNDALIFSRTAVASAADGVNLLSSVINAYGLNSADTNRISAQLFKTIELGRLRASELADKFGNVAALAAPLGVSLNELNAFLATLTIQGIKSDRVMTLLRAVFLKMIKPTKSMKQVFAEWGVESGKSAINTFGFLGVFKKLREEIEKHGIERIGELGGRLRAMVGILGAIGTKQSFELFNKNIREIGDGAENFGRATDLVLESAGFKFQKEINKISNILTVDLGTKLIKIFNETSDNIGGLSSIVTGLTNTLLNLVKVGASLSVIISPLKEIGLTSSNFLTTIIAATAAYKTFGFVISTAMAKASISAVNFANKISLIGTVGLAAFSFIIAKQQEYAEAVENSAERAAAAFDKLIKDRLQKIQEEYNKTIAETEKREKELTAALEKEHAARRKTAIEEIHKILGAIIDVDKDLPDITEKTLDRITKISRKLSDIVFESSLAGLGFLEKIDAKASKISDIFEGMGEVFNLSNIEEARLAFEDITKLASEINQELTRGIEKATRKIKDLQQKRSEKAFDRSLSGLSVSAASAKIRDRIEELRATGINQIGDDAEATFSRITALIQKLESLTKRGTKTGLGKFGIGTDGASLKVVANLEARNLKDQEEAQRRLLEALTSRKVETDAILKRELEIEKSIKRTLDLAKEKADTDRKIRETESKARSDREEAAKRSAEEVEAVKKRKEALEEAGGKLFESATTAKALLDKVFSGFGPGSGAFRASLDDRAVSGLFDSTKKLDEAREALELTLLKKDLSLTERIAAYKEFRDVALDTSTKLEEVDEAISADEFAKLPVESQKDLERYRNLIIDTFNAAVKLDKAIREIAAPPTIGGASLPATVPVPGFAEGGMVSGPGGIDNVFARLTAGEFVVNPDATKTFRPLLEAMNSRYATPRFAQGGAVTSVGDINITVQGGDSREQTVREMGNQLHREIQRGTIRT